MSLRGFNVPLMLKLKSAIMRAITELSATHIPIAISTYPQFASVNV